jgi:hypothetical protein
VASSVPFQRVSCLLQVDVYISQNKMAECFMDKVLTSVEKGSYDLLLHILKTEMCNVPHVYQRIVVALEKTPDQPGLNFFYPYNKNTNIK